MEVLMETNVSDFECRRGKVRDIYDIGNGRLVIIATDRISAFDVVMANGIPCKGIVLTQLSGFWFNRFSLKTSPHHLISTSQRLLPGAFQGPELENRCMLCLKADEVLPVECVVRGYLAGSGWKDYKKTGEVCGIGLSAGLEESQRLSEPIFTPATKAQEGHDENISFAKVCKLIGEETARKVREWSLSLYETAHRYARRRGVIIADTKFEFGRMGDEIVLIDEVLTPDSSRFWPVDGYQPGQSQPSLDKQFVRDHLQKECDAKPPRWDKNPPGPSLSDKIVEETQKKYAEIYPMLTGQEFPQA